MKRYLAICSYDGTNYEGWQIQKGKSTIAGEIMKALQAFHKETMFVIGSSRTDKGVHAHGQAFCFDSNIKMTPLKFKGAINAFLPEDIHVTEVKEVDDQFHARYHAIGKHYRYIINNGNYNPVLRNSEYYVREKLDFSLMVEASKIFIGEHDFSTFCVNKKDESKNQVRKIDKIELSKNNDQIIIDYYGKGFLRYMVRMLTATLVEVGKGNFTVSQVKELLELKDKDGCKYKAPASGLYLMEVFYGKD